MERTGRGAALGSGASLPTGWRQPPVWLLATVTLSALVPLLATWQVSSVRAAAGAFVTLVVVPAFQLLANAFFGRVAALTVGGVAALLTLALVVGPPPGVYLPDAQRRVPLTAAVLARLTPPSPSSALRAVTDGGSALVFVCLARGEASDVAIAFNGVSLHAAAGPVTADCWKRYELPFALLNGGVDPIDVSVTPRQASTVELVKGYSPTRGERPFVELRIFARDGRLVEIWA